MPDQDGVHGLLRDWALRISWEGNYKNYHAPDGRSVVDDQGLLQIGWPARADGGGHVAFDILIATATKPTPEQKTNDYPSAKTVAQAWRVDKNGHVNYFHRNRQHGIYTFQDAEIDQYLKQ